MAGYWPQANGSMSDISWRLGAFEIALITLVLCTPGFFAGLVVGAAGSQTHRLRNAVLGALAGSVLTVCYVLICATSRISHDADGLAGAISESLRVGWPGIIAGALIATSIFRSRRLAAMIGGASIGFIVWLGLWAAFF